MSEQTAYAQELALLGIRTADLLEAAAQVLEA